MSEKYNVPWLLEPSNIERTEFHLIADYAYYIDRSYGKFQVREWGALHYTMPRVNGLPVRGNDYILDDRAAVYKPF